MSAETAHRSRHSWYELVRANHEKMSLWWLPQADKGFLFSWCNGTFYLALNLCLILLKSLVRLDINSQALDAPDVTAQYFFCYLWNLVCVEVLLSLVQELFNKPAWVFFTLKENSVFLKPRPYFWHEIRLSTHREQFGKDRRPLRAI